jgi:NADPH-dependent ferric siderophore reductase
VFHAAGEDEEVISTKKGFAGLFASRLHDKNEVNVLKYWKDILEIYDFITL